jgi:putative Holliday junction resolvase
MIAAYTQQNRRAQQDQKHAAKPKYKYFIFRKGPVSMAVIDLETLTSTLTLGDRLLGLDLGTKTIGLAVSDGTRMTATPVDTIRRTKFTQDAEALFNIVDDLQVHALIFGWPVEMDGTEGKRCQSTMSFAQNLLSQRDMPIAFWDERLSTSAVQRMMTDEMDMSRKRRAEVVDKAAAAYILQGALDALNQQTPPDSTPLPPQDSDTDDLGTDDLLWSNNMGDSYDDHYSTSHHAKRKHWHDHDDAYDPSDQEEDEWGNPVRGRNARKASKRRK